MFLTHGMRTSEFYLAVFANIVAVLDEAHVWNVAPDSWVVVLQTVVTTAYVLSRGWAKSGISGNTKR